MILYTPIIKTKFHIFIRSFKYLSYINITLEKQKVILDDNYDRDVIGYYEEDNYLSINILFIRGGKLLDKKSNIFPMINDTREEVLSYISNLRLGLRKYWYQIWTLI